MTNGHAKVDATVRVTTDARTEVKLKMTAPVFENAYVNVFGVSVPDNAFKTKTIGKMSKVLEGTFKVS